MLEISVKKSSDECGQKGKQEEKTEEANEQELAHITQTKSGLMQRAGVQKGWSKLQQRPQRALQLLSPLVLPKEER